MITEKTFKCIKQDKHRKIKATKGNFHIVKAQTAKKMTVALE